MEFGCVITPRDFAVVESVGFDYAEVSGRAVYAMPQAAYTELKKRFLSGRMPCRGFNAYCPPDVVIAGPGFSEAAAKAYAEALLERAAGLGVRVIGVGSPNSRTLPAGFDGGRAREQTLRFFDATARVFESAGITVCVEALADCYTNHINMLEEACQVARDVARPNLKVVLDFYNMEHMGEADIPLNPYIDEIAHAHISDDAGDPLKRWFLNSDKRDLHIGRLRRLFAAAYRGGVTAEIDLPVKADAAAETLRIFQEAAEPFAD